MFISNDLIIFCMSIKGDVVGIFKEKYVFYSFSFSRKGYGGYNALLRNWMPFLKRNKIKYSTGLFSNNTGVCSEISGLFLLESRRVFFPIRIVLAILDGVFLAANTRIRKKKIVLFSGAEWLGVFSVYVANLLKSQSVIYIVDDTVSHLKKDGRVIELWIYKFLEPIMFKSFVKLFTISIGLKTIFENRTYLSYEYLPLPYIIKNIEGSSGTVSDVTELVFIGSISYLVESALVEFIERFKKINDGSFVLKIVSQRIPVLVKDAVNQEKSILTYENVREENLKFIIDLHSVFLLPYAFEEKYKPMVESSFPSKLLKMIEYSDNVVCYGPDYQVVKSMKYSNDLKFLEPGFTLENLCELSCSGSGKLLDNIKNVHAVENLNKFTEAFYD